MLIRAALLALLFVTSCATTPPPAAPPPELPAIALLTLDGQPTHLRGALNGRVALVALWATWCEACAAEFESLARLSERAAAHGGMVVAVAVGEARSTVAAFVARRALHYPQLVDEEFRLADALGKNRVPTTLVVDRTGHIVFAGGALDESALAALRIALETQVASR